MPDPSPTTNPKSEAAAIGRYLCVELDAEHYAFPLLTIREIQAYSAPTPLPRMPAYVRGVTNLHGDIVPVLDLRLRVGLAERAYDRRAVIVFVTVGPQVVGLVADAASRVIDIPAAQLRPAPELADGIDTSFVAGMARLADRVIIVLDVETLLRGDPALAISTASSTSSRRGS